MRAAWTGLGAALLLAALGMAVPAVLDWDVHVRHFPPLHADWDPRVGWGTVPAVVLGTLSVRYAGDLAARLSWGRLLLAAYAAGLAWMLSLALVDGLDGIGHILDTSYEYLDTARATTDLPATLDEYVSRIPVDAPGGQWPVHIAGHPPGALTFFVVLVRIGLGSGLAAGFVVTLLAASTAVAVLVTLRTLGAEQHARMAAPFLVIGPAAVWQCVSADAMFAAFAAWGMCALAVGAVRRSLPWSVLAGLLLGCCVMFSYGLPLLALLAVAVLVVAGTWRPLVPAALAALGRRPGVRAVRLLLVGGAARAARAVLGRRRVQPPAAVLDVGQPRRPRLQRRPGRLRRRLHDASLVEEARQRRHETR